MTQKLVKLKIKLMIIIIVISILLHRNFKINSEKFAASLAQANLASKSDIAALIKKTDFDDKLKNLNKKSYVK